MENTDTANKGSQMSQGIWQTQNGRVCDIKLFTGRRALNFCTGYGVKSSGFRLAEDRRTFFYESPVYRPTKRKKSRKSRIGADECNWLTVRRTEKKKLDYLQALRSVSDNMFFCGKTSQIWKKVSMILQTGRRDRKICLGSPYGLKSWNFKICTRVLGPKCTRIQHYRSKKVWAVELPFSSSSTPCWFWTPRLRNIPDPN